MGHSSFFFIFILLCNDNHVKRVISTVKEVHRNKKEPQQKDQKYTTKERIQKNAENVV